MAVQGESLAMHAVLRKANSNSNVKGKKTYKLAFEYPPGFLSSMDEYVGETVDIFWNELMIAHGATITGAVQKPHKDDPTEYLITVDAPASDSTIMNSGAAVGDSGDLRIALLQGALSI